MGFDPVVFTQFVTSPLLMQAAWVTLWVATVSQIIGTGIGLVLGPMLLARNRLVFGTAWFYLWIFKGTPLLAQILFFFAALPMMGLRPSLIATGLLALGLNEGARMADIVRAGLMAVPREQHEAAAALGMRRWQTFLTVVLPQAARVILPPLGNNYTYMIKATSLLAAISFAELLRVSQQLSQATTRPLEAYLAASVWYLVIITTWTFLQRRLEGRLALKERNTPAPAAGRRKAKAPAPAPVPEPLPSATAAAPSQGPTRERVIEAQGLNRSFGDIHALRDADLVVHRGEIVVVLGPSGSGKSTLLRALNWLEPPDSGTVRLMGESFSHTASGRRRSEAGIDRMRRRTGMVFQSIALFPSMTAAENVALGLRRLQRWRRGKARERACALLAEMGLAGLEDAFPVELSGGQKQRVGIARAMAMDPAVLLFDEPTSALDPETVGEVLAAMLALAQRGITMVVVTHETGFARQAADRVVFMENGRILMDSPADEAFGPGGHPRFRTFLSGMVR